MHGLQSQSQSNSRLTVGGEEAKLAYAILEVVPEDHNLLRSMLRSCPPPSPLTKHAGPTGLMLKRTSGLGMHRFGECEDRSLTVRLCLT